MTNKTQYRSTFPGGLNVIDCLMRRQLGYALTLSQAQVLWDRCRARLVEDDLRETVAEAESSETGGMDTLTRGDVLDAIAKELANCRWPLNMDSPKFVEDFKRAAHKEALHRGYEQAPD